MSNVFFSLGMSLDGFIAGPNRGPTNPLGDQGVAIHKWAFEQRSFREALRLGDGGETGQDKIVDRRSYKACSVALHRSSSAPTLHIPIRFHDLRHTFATELLRRGVDSYRVQRLMRHSDVRVTLGTYAHLLVDDLRAAADAHTPLPATPAMAGIPTRAAARAVSAQ